MHGIRKQNLSAVEKSALDTKKDAIKSSYIELWSALVNKKNTNSLTCSELGAIDELLKINPENYTGWNMRKEILQNALANASESAAQELLHCELTASAVAIKANPKAYSPWFHRRWCIETFAQRLGSRFHALLDAELGLTSLFLDKDSRNFHCWDYRRFVCAQSVHRSTLINDELEFCMLKLNQNFSNYSAWHYRTQLLPKAFGAADAAAVLRNELKLARAAYFTECRDQSAWMYVVWVLRMLKMHSPEFDALLDEELQHLRDLNALENGSALWPRFFAAILQAFRDPKSSSADFAAEMAHLSTIDPQRRNFYAQLRNDRCFLFDA